MNVTSTHLRTADFAREIWGSLRFFVDYWRGKKYAHGVPPQALEDLEDEDELPKLEG